LLSPGVDSQPVTLEESLEKSRRNIRDGDDLVRGLTIGLEIYAAFRPAVIPVGRAPFMLISQVSAKRT
jgi:hypothetical protein